MGQNGGNGRCPSCQCKLTPVKLYAPEILRLFKEGYKTYSRNGILVSFATCLSPHCKIGQDNLNSYDRVVAEGMIRQE